MQKPAQYRLSGLFAFQGRKRITTLPSQAKIFASSYKKLQRCYVIEPSGVKLP
jgi:hypothetical protein